MMDDGNLLPEVAFSTIELISSFFLTDKSHKL